MNKLARRLLGHNRALEVVLIGTQVAGILTNIVVSRSLGPTGRGIVATVTTWGQVLGMGAAFSFGSALLVLTMGDKPVASPDDGLRWALLPVACLSAVGAVVSVLLGGMLFSSSWLTAALALFVIATAQSELVAAWLLASRGRPAFLVWRLIQPLLFLALVGLISFGFASTSVTLRTTLMAIGVAASIALPVAVSFVRIPTRPLFDRRVGRPLLRFAVAAHVSNILAFLNGRLDLLMLSFLVSATDLGLYAVGTAFGQLTLLAATAGAVRAMAGETHRTDAVGLGLALVIGIGVVSIAPFVIPAVFGTSFGPAVRVAQILAVGGVINFELIACHGRLLRLHRPRAAAITQAMGLVVFAVGILAFPTLHGAAWSSVASFAVALIAANLYLRRQPPSDELSTS